MTRGAALLSRSLLAFTASLLIAAAALPEIVEVELTLPLPARLDLRGRENVVVTPFLTVSLDGDSGVGENAKVDVQKEFDRYLRRILRRTTRLKVLESGPLDFPSYDLKDLSEDGDFWRYVGETTQADLILAGGIDFDVHRLKGYREEPFSAGSATYFRRVLVEKSGFEFDILMLVIDGRSGGLLFADNFKDFREFDRARVDPLVGMYENLDALEARIMNIFAERTLTTARSMFSH
jgi:hypothetical protein